MGSRHAVAAVFATLLLPTPCRAAVLHVPGDHPTIRDAILAASDGDEIEVAPGTYGETLDFLGKAIVVRSSGGPAVTILDAGARGSAARFRSGEGADTILEGFTVTGGTGTWIDHRGIGCYAGGNILCLSASPTLRDNIIRGGTARFGGGIYLDDSAAEVSGNQIEDNHAESGGGIACWRALAVIRDNVITGNSAGGADGGGVQAEECPSLRIESNTFADNRGSFGGGVYATDSAAHIAGNTFTGNLADDGFGGGVYLSGTSSATVTFNEFRSNFAVELGEAFGCSGVGPFLVADNLFEDNGSGATIVCWNSELAVTRNVIRETSGIEVWGGDVEISDNELDGSRAAFAGVGILFMPQARCDAWVVGNLVAGFKTGIRGEESESALEISRNVIRDNTEVGLELFRETSTAQITDNLLTGNRSGGILCYDSRLFLQRCTVAVNEADWPGGGIAIVGDSHATLESNIIWGNQAPQDPQIHDPGGRATVRYCDVEGGWPGVGNLDADPRFRDAGAGDFALQGDSPCIDVGDPGDGFWGRDLAGMPRPLDGNLDAVLRQDMGAHEYGHAQLLLHGDARPGGVLTVEVLGTAGLGAFLLAGLEEGLLPHPWLGPIFVDLAAPSLVLPWGTVPSSTDVTIPANLPVPLDLILQVVALAPGAGNSSNPVELTID